MELFSPSEVFFKKWLPGCSPGPAADASPPVPGNGTFQPKLGVFFKKWLPGSSPEPAADASPLVPGNGAVQLKLNGFCKMAPWLANKSLYQINFTGVHEIAQLK